MQIKNTLFSQNYARDSKQNNAKDIEQLFDSLINEDGDFDISLTEDELKDLSFEEVKSLKIKLEDNGYFKDIDDDINHGLSSSSSGLLKVITFTYDEEFNKSLFDTMKHKENPKVFLEEVIHNIEHFEGKREKLWPVISEEEIQGNYTPLTETEIKSINIQDFLQDTIRAYEDILSVDSLSHEEDETKQSLVDLNELQSGYKTIDSEKNALLSSMMRINRPNPLLNKLI